MDVVNFSLSLSQQMNRYVLFSGLQLSFTCSADLHASIALLLCLLHMIACLISD